MAVNLAKICADLGHPDPQIKTFALMSITRLSKQIVDAPSEIREIAARLRPLSSSDNPDVVFLARKASNHIDQHFKECLAAAEPQAVPPPPPPAAPAELPPTAAEPPAQAVEAAPPAPAPEPVVEVPKDPSTLDRTQLLEWLGKAPTPNFLASLLIQIASKGKSEDLEAVRPLLTHEDDRVRANAVEVFERLAAPGQSDSIVPLLSDRNNRVRGNAVMALARFDHPAVPGTLAEMLGSTAMSMRETAAFVLSRIDKPFVEELLLKALADPYEGVRMRATRALARYPTRPAVLALKRMLNDLDINICEAAAESLRSIKALLQSQRAAAESASAAAPAAAAAELAAPEPPAPPSPAPAPAPPPLPAAAPTSSSLEELQRSLGTEIYQLCRLNLITHESLDSIFYEVLRYQDFLRNYMVKRGDSEDETRKSAIEHLQEKIKSSFGLLGRQAFELLAKDQLAVPAQQEGEAIRRILAELERAGARPQGA